MAAKKGKGQVPLEILEKRHKRLTRIIKERGGELAGGSMGPTPKEWAQARKPPKKKGGKK